MLSFDENRNVALEALSKSGKFSASASKPLAKFVSDFAKAYFKAKSTSLADLRDLGTAVGAEALKGLADRLTVPDATALLKRIDPANGVRAKEDPNWMRTRIAALLAGAAEPDPVVKIAKAKAVPKLKAKRSGNRLARKPLTREEREDAARRATARRYMAWKLKQTAPLETKTQLSRRSGMSAPTSNGRRDPRIRPVGGGRLLLTPKDAPPDAAPRK